MSRHTAVPDAWDDDWERAADTSSAVPEPAQPAAKLTRAERKAQHQELNRQIWQAAEQPERSYFLEARGDVPLKTDFKPQVTLLSRKPTPQIAKRMAGLNLDGDDSEEEERKRQEASLAERQRKAAEERKEKERKYAEVRERLFGSADSPRDNSSSRGPSNRGDRGNRRGGRGARSTRDSTPRDSQPTSSADHSPARSAFQPKQLFDPGYDQKPRHTPSPRAAASRDEQPIRMPRGPENSGRGGFGFAPRGGRPGA